MDTDSIDGNSDNGIYKLDAIGIHYKQHEFRDEVCIILLGCRMRDCPGGINKGRLRSSHTYMFKVP